MKEIIVMIIVSFIYVFIIEIVKCITNREHFEILYRKKKMLKQAQKEWDEYSKDMTTEERDRCYFQWCEQRVKDGKCAAVWYPSEFHVPVMHYETTINGRRYRGTKEEISKQSGVPMSILCAHERVAIEYRIY